MSTMPTRIIKPPYEKLSRERKWTKYILCDNRKEYTMAELAEMVGFKSSHGLWQRIDANGWDHPDILARPKGKGRTISGVPCTHMQFEKGSWAGLSGASRYKNLEKIPEPGTWESRQ